MNELRQNTRRELARELVERGEARPLVFLRAEPATTDLIEEACDRENFVQPELQVCALDGELCRTIDIEVSPARHRCDYI